MRYKSGGTIVNLLETKSMKKSAWVIVWRFIFNISAWIAIPIIIALYLGNWLDQKFGTSPWLLLGTIGVSFFISMYGLAITATKEFKRISPPQKEDDKTSASKKLNSKF